MVAKGGTRLINQSAIKTLKDKLINKAYLITPNIPEAEVLTNIKIKSLEDMIHDKVMMGAERRSMVMYRKKQGR